MFFQAKYCWKEGEWQGIIKVDGRGYYAYLPAIFIYDDLNFEWFQEVEVDNISNPGLTYYFVYPTENGTVNRYFCGEAVLLLPFFLLAHLWCIITGSPPTGYSFPYMIMLAIAAIFYFMLGLIFVRKLLRSLGMSPISIIVSLFALGLGTNLWYYTIREMSMSHVYSFSMVAVFAYLIHRYFSTFDAKKLILAAGFMGLIVLIRPVNALVLLASPLLAGSWSKFIDGAKAFFSKPILIAGTASIVLALFSLQLIVYYIQTGHFWVYSYDDEGFNWLSPEAINFMFSYKKGWFVYTPLAFLFVLSSFAWWKKLDRFKMLTYLGFTVAVVYVLSSWWMWYYGGSFGCRPIIEFYPILILPFATILTRMKPIWWLVVLPAVAFGVWLNQGQSFQYIIGSMHWDSMDKEFYWRIFPLLF